MIWGKYPLFQYAYYVNDIDEAARRWNEVVGAGPFFAARHHQTDRFAYRGEPVEADVSYAFAYAGDTQIQLIQQHDETPSIYKDMYGPGEEGFHHIATLVHDFEAEIKRFTDMGFEVACRLWADDVDAAYIDTRSALGYFTEIHGDPVHIIETFARWKQAHEQWDGNGELIIE